MSTQDIIKNSVLEGFQSDISLTRVLVVLAITVVLSLYIYLIYRLSSNANFYSKDFNKAMVSMSVITAGIVLAMQSNLIISLGMVGALSIVRFRNAVKNPLDLLFLFWSISVGIICGAGIYSIAIAISAAVTVLVFALDLIRDPRSPYILVVNAASGEAETPLLQAAKTYGKGIRVRTRSISGTGANFVLELHSRQEQELVAACQAIPGVSSVSLMAHDGAVRF